VLAVAFTGAVILLRVLAEPWMGHRPFLLVFLIPVILAAYMNGLRPGLFATALSGIVTKLLVFPPFWSVWFADSLDFAHWLFMLLVGVLISVLFDELQQWRDKTAERSTERQYATTERKVRIGFAIGLAFLGAIGIVSYLSVSRFTENAQLVAHSQLVMSNIDALVATTFETESAQRAYVLTGEEPFAAEYTRAMGRVEGLVQQLRDAVSAVPAQLARVDPLAAAVRARMAHSSELIDLRRSGGVEAVQRRLSQTANRPGASLQSKIRALAQEMKVAEIDLLNERERDAKRSAQVTQSVIIGGSVLALIFVSLALYAIRRDFAGRARAENELNRFFDLSIDLFTIASPDGTFKRMSPAVTDILGYTMDEALKLDYMEKQHPDDRRRTVDVVDAQINRGERVENFESRFLHKDGTYRVLSWRSKPEGGLMYATARDVTDQHAAATALREAKEQLEVRVEQRTSELALANDSLRKSERRFRALIENGADGVALIDANRKILYLSPAVTNIEGYQPEELIGTHAEDLTHPDDIPLMASGMQKLLDNPGKPASMVVRRRHKNGHWVWLEALITNQLDDPSVGAIVINYRDITERLEHEARLSEQMRRLALMARITRAIGERQDLRSIFQAMVRSIEDELPVDFCLIGLYQVGENRLTVSCVGARTEPVASGLDMTEGTVIPIDENGLSRCVQGELVYEPSIDGSPFPFPKRLASAGMRSLVIAPLLVESQVFGVLVAARRTSKAFSSGECEFVRQAMEHTALAAHQAQLYAALQRAYDDLRTSQQQIMQQERLRALGQMASGIAHDINNAISPVALYTEALLEREPNLTERGRSQLEIIQRAVDDIAQTVARMGEFYRLREPQLTLIPVDLNKLVGHVIDLTRARWSDMAQQRGAAIEMRTELDPNLPLVAAVESQIRDALVNLVFNAVDAMPDGGPITIRTHLAMGSRDQIVLLEVQDAGVGMDEDTRRRCLEPFFTTKGTRGTGLGLAMVYGVAQRHGASLEIESEPGKGTLIRMTFAIAAAVAATPSGRALQPAGPMRILIIDDDPLLLKSLRDTLEVDGHDVTAANGGQAGIEAFVESHAEGRPFPVVITDLGMPHVDGRKVASTVKASVPSTTVLMLTGWGRRLVAEGDVPPGVDQILSKPPKLLELRAALARKEK
jgi:PAS domain S-box-containing protein